MTRATVLRNDSTKKGSNALVWIVSIFVLLACPLLTDQAHAQANIHNGGVPLNVDQNSNNRASGTLENRGSDSDANTVPYRSAQFDMGFSLTGTGGGQGAIWQGGIEYQETGGVDIIYAQATRVDRNAGKFPTFDFLFTRGVEGLTFVMGGIDNFDSNRLTFYYDGSPISASTAWVTATNPNSGNSITPLLLSATELEVASRNANGSSGDLLLNTATITLPAGVLVDRVVIEGGKNNNNTVNTLSFFNFDWDPIEISAVADTVGSVNGVDGDANAINVLANDVLDDPDTSGTDTPTIGVSSSPLTVTLTQDATSNPNVTLNESTGVISVASGTPSGTYTVNYTICENNTVPTSCSSSVATVTVMPSADLSVTKTNTPGVNGNVDQTNDTVASGSTTTYSITVTNNGPDTASNTLVTDTIGSGLTCPASNTVTITGNGVPAGSFTVSDLTGAGITLGSLADGQSATLTYSCQVS